MKPDEVHQGEVQGPALGRTSPGRAGGTQLGSSLVEKALRDMALGGSP